jgi:nucleotide-binding universal stress UspA family protein
MATTPSLPRWARIGRTQSDGCATRCRNRRRWQRHGSGTNRRPCRRLDGCHARSGVGYDPTRLGPRGGPLEDEILAIGETAIEAVRAELSGAHPDLVIESEFVQDRAADALINVAAARNAEVIAVGHGGEGPMRGALLGSITYELVHRAPRPVLVVPDDPDD